jgi:predicted PhzF superfamily epimerase YddE/YHI9
VIIFPANDPWPADSVLQQIAAEFNYAETAYVRHQPGKALYEFDLRWFTPVQEVK